MPSTPQTSSPKDDAYGDFLNQLSKDTAEQQQPEQPDTLAPVAADPAAPTAPPQESEGFFTKAGKALAGIGAGIVRAPGQAVGSVIDATKDATEALGVPKTPSPLPGFGPLGAYLMLSSPMDKNGTAKAADVLSLKQSLGQVGYSGVNQATAEIGGIILGAEGLAQTRFLAALPKVLQTAGYGAVAGGIVIDPDAERLSSYLTALGIHTEFTDWLAAPPEQASHMENRLKNTVEGLGLNLAADYVFKGLRWMYRAYKAGPEAAETIAAKEEAQQAAKQVIPEQAQPKETQTAISEDGTVTANGEPTVKFESKADYEDLVKAAKNEARPSATAKPMPPIGDSSNVAPMLRQLAIDLHDTPHTVKPDAVLYEDAIKQLATIGLDPQTAILAARDVSGKMASIDSSVIALKTAWEKVAKDVDDFSTIGIESLPDADLGPVTQAIHNVIVYTGYFADIRSQGGRMLRSFGLPDAKAYMEEVATKQAKLGSNGGPDFTREFLTENAVVPLPQTRQEIADWLEMFASTKASPKDRMNFLQGVQVLPSQWKYLRTSFANWFTASVLSGVPSISMNVFGPGVLGVLHTFEKTTGGFTASLFARTAEERAALRAVSTNAARAYVATIGDIPTIFRYAKQAARENNSIIGGGFTANDLAMRNGPITEGMLRAAQRSDGINLGYRLGNAINFLPRQFQRINAGLDEFAKRASYMGETRLEAYVEAAQKGLKGEAADAFVTERMQASIDQASGLATNEDTLRTAERTTLTGSFQNDYHPNISRIMQSLNNVRREYPEARYIFPIFNVPANSVGETIRRIPVLNFILKETRAELSGELGQLRQADAYGRTMLGGLTMLMGFAWARAGNLTGPGPSNPADRQLWLQTHQPYSFKVGDKWVAYDRFDLPGGLLAIPAALYDATVNRTQDQEVGTAIMGGIGALAQYFKDKAALQGMSNLLDFGSEPAADQNFFNRVAGNTTARMVVPNFVTQLARNTQDPTKRFKKSPSEYLMDALPWASQELDPMRNVLGEPTFKPQNSFYENVLPITITPVTTDKVDPEMAELSRLYETTGYAAGVKAPSSYTGGSEISGYFDPRTLKLENGRSLYDALISHRMTAVDDIYGTTLRGALKELFASDEYKEAVDGDARGLVDSLGQVSKAALVRRVFSDFDEASRRDVAESSPIARKWLAAAAAKATNGSSLRNYSVKTLVETPRLMQSLGIDITEFEDKIRN